jgi:drug/metabolite transporter (DMT)-like permease
MVGGRCPGCGTNPVASYTPVHRQLRPHFFALTLGFFGTMFGTAYYHMLDGLTVIRLAVGIYLVALLTVIVAGLLRRLPLSLNLVKSVQIFGGGLLILLAGLVWGNGALDHAATTSVRSTILSKGVTHGRNNSKGYHLTVASWRPGRLEEQLDVKGNLFRSLSLNEPVLVEVHPGRFGMPWYSSISAAPLE